jgi:cytochrome c peroxidase
MDWILRQIFQITAGKMQRVILLIKANLKVPSLRNIEVTGPYMHDGRFTTLEEVVDHYNGGIQNSNSVDPAILFTSSTGLMLDPQEKADLVNFLKTLTDYTFLSNPAYQSPFKN